MQSFTRFFSQHGLWHHKDFLKFWAGETISAFGSQITAFALPIIAALTLKASAVQMGILSFLAFAPMLFLTLFVGVIVDRFPRRPVLITASLGQAITLGTIPLVSSFHFLNLTYLYAIALFNGCLTVFFEVTYQAYLPSLVEPEHTLEANGKMETSHSLAQIVGPGLAGWIVQLITAPLAILIDACSFLISALFLGWIRKPEPKPEHHQTEQAILKEIGQGLQIVLRHPIFRAIAACNATINLFSSAIMSIVVLYIIRDLKIAPIVYGFILATGSLGALLGSFLTRHIVNRFGPGPTVAGSVMLYGIGGLFIPLASISKTTAIPSLIVSWFLQSLTLMIFNITQVSLRQRLTPRQLQGRLNASMRFLICSTLPIGSLLGGALGSTIGLLPTIILATIGTCSAFLWAFWY